MYIVISLGIVSSDFQLMGMFGDNGKLYLHVGDIAKILGRDGVEGWIEDHAHVKFGDIASSCDSVMQKSWSVELGGLINFLENMKPVYGSDLYDILTKDKVAKYQKPVTSSLEIVAKNIRHLTANDLRWSMAPLTRLMMVRGEPKHKPTAPNLSDMPPEIFNDDLLMEPRVLSSPKVMPPPPPPKFDLVDPSTTSVQYRILKKMLSTTTQRLASDQQQQESSPFIATGSNVAQPSGLLMIAGNPSPNHAVMMPPRPVAPFLSPASCSKTTRPNFLQHLLTVPELSLSAALPPPPPISPYVTTPPVRSTRPNILRKQPSSLD